MNIQTTVTENATYYTYKTLHKGFVTGVYMVPLGEMYADFDQRILPSLLAEMLPLGTIKHTEDEINYVMESKAITIRFKVTEYCLVIKFTSLKEDIKDVITLIMEQLTQPALDQKCFEHLRSRIKAHYQSLLDDTGSQAKIAVSQLLYPKEHIARIDNILDQISLLESVSTKQIKQWFDGFDPLLHAKWVVVGDVDSDQWINLCEQYQPKGNKIIEIRRSVQSSKLDGAQKQHIEIKDKQSIDLLMALPLPLTIHHPDYLPMKLAVDALGGSFSARLMRTVRDEEGLTYNVGSSLQDFIPNHQGFWAVHGSFSPKLIDQGIASIQKQLNIWNKKGLSQLELAERQEGIAGKYVVSLSDANSIVNVIADIVMQGFDLDRFYSYPELIRSVKLDDVNRVIHDYIDLNSMIQVTAGSKR